MPPNTMASEQSQRTESSQKNQTEVTETVKNFLGDYRINKPDDVIPLIKHIKNFLEFREYSQRTKQHADSIQWKRTATEILNDGFVYSGKACSDLVIILIALCRAADIEAQLLKFIRTDGKSTHSIAEFKINGDWYRIDPTLTEPKPFKGYLTDDQIWNKDWEGGWKVWKRGTDLWSMGLDGIDVEGKVYSEE